jgi:GT2 family glycosyltransferase
VNFGDISFHLLIMSTSHPATSPFFSILVLNWNGKRYLARCLDAVAAQTFRDFEVIVLDNASSDHSTDGVEANWPGFRVVQFEQNLGFSMANNRGALLAAGEWLACLNNDAFPEPDWLMKLKLATEKFPEFAFFSSLLIDAENPKQVQGCGDVYNISGYAWSRDYGCPIEQSHQMTQEVFSPCGAAALYKRTAFIEAGGFDEDFVSHHEDVDLGFRLRLLGYRCLYVPEAVVSHVGGAGYGRESDRTVYQVQRNVVWSYMTNMPGWLLWKYLPAHLLANLVFIIYYSLRGQAKAVWKAKWDAVFALPRIRARRGEIQKQRLTRTEDIEQIIDRRWWAPFTLGKRSRILRQALDGSQGVFKSP